MSLYIKYNIANTDKFNSGDYPKVVDELSVLHEKVVPMQGDHAVDMIISYVKDHCMKTDWVHSNPKLAALIISSSFPTYQTESLFESCRRNVSFLTDLEAYIRKVFSSRA